MSGHDIKHREFLEEKLLGQALCFQPLTSQFLQMNYLVYVRTWEVPSFKADCYNKKTREILVTPFHACRPGGLPELIHTAYRS